MWFISTNAISHIPSKFHAINEQTWLILTDHAWYMSRSIKNSTRDWLKSITLFFRLRRFAPVCAGLGGIWPLSPHNHFCSFFLILTKLEGNAVAPAVHGVFSLIFLSREKRVKITSKYVNPKRFSRKASPPLPDHPPCHNISYRESWVTPCTDLVCIYLSLAVLQLKKRTKKRTKSTFLC